MAEYCCWRARGSPIVLDDHYHRSLPIPPCRALPRRFAVSKCADLKIVKTNRVIGITSSVPKKKSTIAVASVNSSPTAGCASGWWIAICAIRLFQGSLLGRPKSVCLTS